jgi:spermidine synthase
MPGAQLNADVWITEYITPYDVYHHGITRVLASADTPFQQMHIVETGSYGKALVLDGKWQSCTGDEFLYHEPLVQVACVNHGSPRTVLVLGGGEGATVREALKWKSVEKVVMVDLDGAVVDACREHLSEMHQGAFNDPRTEVVIADALDYLDNADAQWDVIISDLSDPIEEGPSFKLFTREYFEKCKRALSPGGYFTVQAGPVAPAEMDLHVRLASTVRAVFKNMASYVSHVPTYASPWGFVIGSDQSIDAEPDPAPVDQRLQEGTSGSFRMFDGICLRGMMSIPKHLREAIANETEVYSLASPPKFFGKGISER